MDSSVVARENNIAKAIGTSVQAARLQVGLSRKRLADKAEVSERYLNQLEHGEANVSIGILARVADALAVDLVSLFPSVRSSAADGLTANAMDGGFAELVGGMSLSEQQGAIELLQSYLKDRRCSLRGIALLGLRGAGKSTIGGLFAERHGLPFLSVTREIEARAGMSLSDLFNLGGPDAYRLLENEVVRELAGRDDRIIVETAGGIVSNKDAMEVIFNSFKTVWLKAAPEEHLKRVIQQGDMRPMRGWPAALENLKALLAQREPDYAHADCVLDTSGCEPEACVDELDRIAGAVTRPPSV
jgi:XRE family transcriptional regulator, aerobic/anaerobic benzoate catabolism transcriptional regulator